MTELDVIDVLYERRSRVDKRATGVDAGSPEMNRRLPYLFWRGAAGAGVPVVAGASSGVHVIALRSYLKPLALLSASFVEFMTKIPFVVVFGGGPDRIEGHGDVLLAHAKEAPNADDER
jgi:hypothetical protein